MFSLLSLKFFNKKLLLFLILLFSTSCSSNNSIGVTSQNIDVKDYLGLNQKVYSSLTGKGVTIAILDTGISNHVDISSERILHFKDFVNESIEPYDDNGHGTFVTGIIGANGQMKGIAPEANFVILKIIDSHGNSYYNNLTKALTWLEQHNEDYNIKIVNMSFGIKRYQADGNDLASKKIKSLSNKGLTFIVSSGNYGPDNNSVLYPGNLDEVVTVGYVNNKRTKNLNDDKVAENSGRGNINDLYCKPDLVTLGVDIQSLGLNNSYSTSSGSSFATAIVSGVSAILMENNKDWDFNKIKKALFTNVHPIKDAPVCSQGKGNLHFAK